MPLSLNLLQSIKPSPGQYRVSLALLFTLVLAACAGSLPPLEQRTVSQSLSPAEARATTMGQAISPLAAEHPEQSGILPIVNARDAFASRKILAEAAEQTLDVQYYIWSNDKTGILLLDALLDAAERGVRVRLLLDDLNTRPLDDKLALLHAHPNIEVRLFNPFLNRNSRALGFVTDFNRANRRMHNKSFTADSMATIIGGRNIGDKYFGTGDDILFADLDVLAIGSVVEDVSRDFDRYWASSSTFPAHLIIDEVSPGEVQRLQEQARRVERDPAAAAFVRAIRDSDFYRQLLNQELDFIWAETRMVSDSPAKGLGLARGDDLIVDQLSEAIGEPQELLELVSPYFVPTRAGVDALLQLVEQGIEVSVLTNSLEATDVAIVHAGYAKWRKELLEGGVRLYEMQRLHPEVHLADEERLGRFASAASSLHAKTFSIDRERVFIGSLNFDPRSAQLNTELGFVIESPKLAQAIDDVFNEQALYRAYEVRLSYSGRLYWLERRPGHVLRHDTEPGTTAWQRNSVRLLSWLPIDWLL